MESKNKMGYDLIPPKEPMEHQKEAIMKESPSPVYNNDEGGEKKRTKKKKDKKLRFRKTLWFCLSNVQIGSSRVPSDDEKKKKEKDHDEFKDGFFFSNVELEGEEEEEKEKVQKLVEKMNNKSCLLVCFSNVQVGKDH